jgi:DNA/RNA endonuclease G (NUC1)
MTPGDKFFFMLVPNGTVQQVYDNPAIGGDKKPLFSIATENPNDGFSIGQIADITGEGQLFVMEDMAPSQESYRDYDDITFRVTGATSQIVPLSKLAGDDSASIHSDSVQKLKGESDKSEPLLTGESTVTNSADQSPAKTPSITADNDQQKPQQTAATVARSDSQESLATETSTVANSDSQQSPVTETSTVDKSDTQESPATETSTVDKSDTQESPATETSTVDKSDTQELPLVEQTASPPETPSVSPTELNSEIEQPVSGESIVSESAGAELIKTDTTTNLIPQLPAIADDAVNNAASPPTAETLLTSTPLALQPPAKTDALAENLGKELPTETDDNLSNAASQPPTNIAEVIPASQADDTQKNDRAVSETAAFLETEQLPQKTDALAVAEFTPARSDTDIAVAFTAAEFETENPPAIAVNSLEPEPLISNSNSGLQTDSPIPALFSTSSETAAGTAQIASVETSVSPSTVKSPPEPTSNTNNSSSTPTETTGSLPTYSENEIAPKPADISSGLLPKEAEESAQMSDGIADIVPNPTQRAGDFQSNTNSQANRSITAAANSLRTGTFLVENAQGQVKFDYQFDGGYYQGELGIFSLSGMEALAPGSPEFIAEAARRVLTNSTEGHIVIRDSIEGSKFTGAMPGEGSWGSELYQGIKTFNMTPGDTFAVMLVPSGTVQSSLQFSWLWDLFPENRPLFSIADANPNNTSYVLPIADATGTGNTFALEDMSAANSDGDYNDLIFKISGATGNAPLLDTVINPDKEWRNTPLGQQLLAEANPSSNSDNNPPVVSPTSAQTYTELETTISLENLAADAEGDPLTISVLNPVNGTVIFNPLTNKASFKPSPGFSGIASFDFLASDAFGSSSPARVTVNVSDVPLLNLDFVKRNPRLNAGENTELVVLGDFADQQDVELPDSYLTYTSLNPEVAPIDATGKVTGLTNGTSILSASRNNLQAVTPIRIGAMPQPTTDAQLHQILAELYGLDPYPDAVSLTPGATRKLSLGLNSNLTEANLTAASTGTRYFSNNSNILNVSPDGTITAVGIGDAAVTAIYGAASATIPVRVEAPLRGPTALGTDGGIINSNDGTLAVMIPPGALEQNATVSIAPVNQQNLSLPLPPGFEFAGAFNLDFGDNSLNIPAQLAIPAPEGLAPGTQAYFLRKGAIPDATGTWKPIWLQEESGIVGDDGMIRTQSPPYPGVVRPGEYAVVYDGPAGSATLVKGQLTLNYNFPLAFFGIIDPLGNLGQLINPDNFVTTPAFTVTRDISSVQVVAIPKVGLPVVTEVGVQRNDDGTATFKAALDMPAPTTSDPTTPPVLQKAELKSKDDSGQPFENNERLLFLTGGNILVNNASDSKGSKFEDLTVKFSVGNQVFEGAVVPTRSRSLGGNQYEVAVKVPDTVLLGASGVVLERKQNQIVEQQGVTPVYEEIKYNSNPIRLPQGAEYVFAALGNYDAVAVFNGKNPESVVDTTNSEDLLLETIFVGTSGVTDWAESTAVTSDGNRVYATLRDSGQVALVDPMVRRQVDTQPNTPGVNPIVLPPEAKPKSIAIDPRDEYAYIADRDRGDIYVLDIDPFSATYHEVIETIKVGSNTTDLRNLAISSDGRKLFATASDNYIYAVNIDPKDRPRDPNSNPRKWHEQIGAVDGPRLGPAALPLGVTGVAATSNPLAMTFTSGNTNIDANGYGVLEITNDDPLNFKATNRYIDLSLGDFKDYFDVTEGVSVTVTRDGRYGFVAGLNSASLRPFADPRSGSNIGIIEDPLGPNARLVAATRPIPKGLTNDLVLSNDNKSLFSSYPAPGKVGAVYVFDVEEIIKTLEHPEQFINPATGKPVRPDDFAKVPIDDINPAISIAADYGILQGSVVANNLSYGVFPGTKRAPVGTRGNLRDLSIAPTDWLDLLGPGATTNDLTPTLNWKFAPGWEDVKEVNLFVSTFDKGEGLLPDDRWEDLANIQNPNFNNLSPQQQQNLLAKWNSQFGTLDYNPNRILTATWKPGQGWVGLGGLPLDPSNTNNTQFTLPDNRTLTAGQTYHWAVEALSKDGKRNLDVGQFKTSPAPALNGNSTFSSVTLLTHGFKPPVITGPGIPSEFYKMADSIATTGGEGLLMRYGSRTGNWVPIDKYGQVLGDFFSNLTYFPNGFDEATPSYRTALSSYIAPYLQANKPLVLLPDWSQNNESAIPDSGFTEAAADTFFASLVQLDQSLGGDAKFDSQGNFVRSQGAIFNSPLHFVGFSRGTVVNSEIIQRVGTYFPLAGGKENSLFRDLQMTTLDPHDFDQPSFSVKLPFLGEAGFADFREPKVQVWKNVTFADNYYQTVPRLDQGLPQIPTLTPAGRDIPNLSGPDALRTEIRAGLKFPRNSAGELLGKPDETVFLGTRRNADGYENSLPGFTRDDLAGGTHGRVLTWYAGTADLGLTEYRQNSSSTQPVDPIWRRRGDGHYEQLFDRDFSFSGTPQDPRVNPWYTPKYSGQPNFSLGAANAPNEGIGTGWFSSVLGGGLTKDPNTGAITNLRSTNNVERVPLSFDNTAERRMRGDFAIPTLFNGNFDAVFNPRSLFRNAISDAIPGWSFHNDETSASVSTNNLVDVNQLSASDAPALHAELDRIGVDRTQPNYALKLESGKSITHNRFVVPDWGNLRFDLHVPEAELGSGRSVLVTLEAADGSPLGVSSSVKLTRPNHTRGSYLADTQKIGYGIQGFETFQFEVPDNLRGQVATLKFEVVGGGTVYLDNVFFKSQHLLFGNPSDARNTTNLNVADSNNYLLEKAQFATAYDDSSKTPKWVSWQMNQKWLGETPRSKIEFIEDQSIPESWGRIVHENYTYSNYSRGHLVPSKHRNNSKKDNIATFLLTNVLPLHYDNNDRFLGEVPDHPAWQNFDDILEKITESDPITETPKELYVVAGGYGSNLAPQRYSHYSNLLTNPQILINKGINIPGWTWKVVLDLEQPGLTPAGVTIANAATYGILIPNEVEPDHVLAPDGTVGNNGDFALSVPHPFNALLGLSRPDIPNKAAWRNWQTWKLTVNEIEALTGLDFFSNIPDEIEEIIESGG